MPNSSATGQVGHQESLGKPTGSRSNADGPWRDVSEAMLQPFTEQELVDELREGGSKVEQHRGRPWLVSSRGLYTGIHLGARFSAEEAKRPSPRALAYRVVLTDADAARANASLPAHILTNVADFSSAQLSSNRRYHLRRCRKNVQIVQVMDMALMADEGYDVFVSAQERTRVSYREMWSRDTFVKRRSKWVDADRRITLAGLIDGRVSGYLSGYAVDSTAYLEIVDIATDALKTHVSTCLHVAFVELCQRSPGITEIVHSQHIPEDKALGTYKSGVGFPVVRLPVRLSLPPMVGPLLRWRRPFVHYRLTGQENAAVRAAVAGEE